jgi:glycosyltransferase EpsF
MVVQLHPTAEVLPLETPQKAIRVLHVVESLDNQAVETWLLRVLRAATNDYPHIHWTFFCVLSREGRYDSTARKLGAQVIHSSYEIGDKLRFVAGLREVMKRGHYDVLHCHHDIMSAAYLLASVGLAFRKRIVHVHNTSTSLPTPSRVKAEIAREPMRQICLRMANQIVGISSEALTSLTGTKHSESSRQRVIHYAVDTRRFAQVSLARPEFRRQLGFGPNARVLLFVGRLVDYKNPLFVLEVLESLIQSDPEAVVVFVGAGDLENVIAETLNRKNLKGRARLLGFRDDVPELMANCDVLIWPSLEKPKEGLGLGIIEAQAAGLPIVMSRSVPEEAIIVSELIQVLPLAAGADAWASAIHSINMRAMPARSECLSRVESSSFGMHEGVTSLMALYGDLSVKE